MMRGNLISRNTIIGTEDAKTQVIRTDEGYYLSLTTHTSFTYRSITKKEHDLMVKSLTKK